MTIRYKVRINPKLFLMNIYDQIFATDKRYNAPYRYKLKIVLKWVKKNQFRNVLDVGSGRGHYLRLLRKNTIEVTGLEPSKVIVDTLNDYDVINDDILGLVKQGKQWESLICMDVLEHIEPAEIENTVSALATLSPKALLGIANHSDVWHGTELHLIQEGPSWWKKLLPRYYNNINCIYEDDLYFVFDVGR